MAISDNVREVRNKILQEVIEEKKSFTEDVQTKAVRAILAGLGDNKACQDYFGLFATTPAELDRLLGKDGTTGLGHEGRDRARAYLMANGPCGSDTVLRFENTVTFALD